MRILLADQDFATGSSIRGGLMHAGFLVVSIDDLEDVASVAKHEEFDLIVLVAPRAGGDPYSVVAGLRRARINIPVMMLGIGQSLDVVRGLNAGADELLRIPVETAELVARCRALARRARGFSKHELTVGALTLDPESRDARVFGRRLNLTSKEFAVLELLTLRRRQVVRKDAMLSQLYAIEDSEPDQKIIDVFICKLRKKLAAAGAGKLITTVWGLGYRLEELGAEDDELAEGDKTLPLRLAS